ncbi:hypothetical protein LEMLEM_LOCUS12847 [Lemmus lemmus]
MFVLVRALLKKEGREMAGEKGDSPGCWAERRQGGAVTTGIFTGLVKLFASCQWTYLTAPRPCPLLAVPPAVLSPRFASPAPAGRWLDPREGSPWAGAALAQPGRGVGFRTASGSVAGGEARMFLEPQLGKPGADQEGADTEQSGNSPVPTGTPAATWASQDAALLAFADSRDSGAKRHLKT